MGENITAHGIPKKGLPEGFFYLDELIPDCIIDVKYAGTENFMGRIANGYSKPLIVASAELAAGCVKAAEILRRQGYYMKFYDAYRPQRAVDDFVLWGKDLDDQRRKPVHYPNLEKADMFALDYISYRSQHTRGSAVDLTIVDANTHQELDMGSIFDYMDARSRPGAQRLSAEQEKNRLILSDAMCACGFEADPDEWWHFHLLNEPYPDTYFDFPIE